MATEIKAALGEDETRPVGVAVHREQDRRVGPARSVHPLRLPRTQKDAGEVH
jgi:hypothetical protein